MLISIDSQGNANVIQENPIYRGSVIQNLTIVAPFDQSMLVSYSAELPNKTLIDPIIMTPNGTINYNGVELNSWTSTIPTNLTYIAGILKLTITGLVNDQIIVTSLIEVPILPTSYIPPTPPEIPQEDVNYLVQLLQYSASQVNSIQFSGEVEKLDSEETPTLIIEPIRGDEQYPGYYNWDYKFKFQLPKGDKGGIGPVGPTGPSVAAGAQILSVTFSDWEFSGSNYFIKVTPEQHNLGVTEGIGLWAYRTISPSSDRLEYVTDLSYSNLNGEITIVSPLQYEGIFMFAGGVYSNTSESGNVQLTNKNSESITGNATNQSIANTEIVNYLKDLNSSQIEVNANESISGTAIEQSDANIEFKSTIEGIQQTLSSLASASMELRTSSFVPNTSEQNIPFTVSTPTSNPSSLEFISPNIIVKEDARYTFAINVFVNEINDTNLITVNKYQNDILISTNDYPFNSFSDTYVIDVIDGNPDNIRFTLSSMDSTTSNVTVSMNITTEGVTNPATSSDTLTVTSAESLTGTATNQQTANIQLVTQVKQNQEGLLTKREEVTTNSQIYATDTSGNQTSLPYSEALTANSIVTRDSQGRIKTSSASDQFDAINKNDADALETDLKSYSDDSITNYNQAIVQPAISGLQTDVASKSPNIYKIIVGVTGNGYAQSDVNIWIPSVAADAATYINQAIAQAGYGGRILLREGDYGCMSTINLNKNIILEGSGLNSTHIKTITSYGINVTANSEIRNLTLENTSTSASSWWQLIRVSGSNVSLTLQNLNLIKKSAMTNAIDPVSSTNDLYINNCLGVTVAKTTTTWRNIYVDGIASYSKDYNESIIANTEASYQSSVLIVPQTGEEVKVEFSEGSNTIFGTTTIAGAYNYLPIPWYVGSMQIIMAYRSSGAVWGYNYGGTRTLTIRNITLSKRLNAL